MNTNSPEVRYMGGKCRKCTVILSNDDICEACGKKHGAFNPKRDGNMCADCAGYPDNKVYLSPNKIKRVSVKNFMVGTL